MGQHRAQFNISELKSRRQTAATALDANRSAAPAWSALFSALGLAFSCRALPTACSLAPFSVKMAAQRLASSPRFNGLRVGTIRLISAVRSRLGAAPATRPMKYRTAAAICGRWFSDTVAVAADKNGDAAQIAGYLRRDLSRRRRGDARGEKCHCHRLLHEHPSPKRSAIHWNGFTITRITTRVTSSAGTSFSMRSVFSLSGRSPRASFLAKPTHQP